MKTHKSFLVMGIILMASIMAPINAQWTEAYNNPGGFYGISFPDSLNGWFTHLGVDKIIHTSDGGHTFDVQLAVALPFNMEDVYMEDAQNGWACGSNTGFGPGYIYRTTNGGADWIQVNHPASQSNWGQILKVGSSIWIVGSYDGSFEYLLILKTSNNGTTWELSEFPQHIGGYINAFDSLNFIVYGVNGTLDRTTDGGNSWISTNLPSDYQVEKVRFQDNNLGYALVSNIWSNPPDGYLYRTTDGGFTWNLHYSWVDQGQKQGLSIIPNTGTIFVGGWLSMIPPYLFGMLKSIDGGNTWSIVMTDDFGCEKIFTPNTNKGWATAGPYIYRYDYVVPPIIQPISNKLIQLGEAFTYQVEATGMGLEYSMTGNPQGLSIGNYSGLINGVSTEGGKFDITVTVQDTDANSVTEGFRLKVNRKPHFLPPLPPTHAWVDSTYQVTLNVEDVDDDTVSFSWLTKPSWLIFLTEGITNVTLLGVPSVSDTGYHSISVLADDGYGGLDTLSWLIQVEVYTPVNHAPQFVPPFPDTLAVVDSVYSVMLYAEDIDGDTLNFSWTTKPTWLVMVETSISNVHIQGIPSISDTGFHQASVIVSDNKGGSDTYSWTIHVLYSPPPVNNLPQFAGTWPDTVTVYRDSSYAWDFLFQDADGDTLYSIPGAVGVPGLTLLPGQGVGEVTANVTGTPTDTGWYEAVVAVKDEHGAQGSLHFTVHVDFPTSVEPLPGIPTEFGLNQNYPNPFNPVTTIRYQLPQATEVNLAVYNLLGQEIEMLVNEYQPMGIYEASFDASRFPSGTYFYRLQAGNYIQTKKMILLK